MRLIQELSIHYIKLMIWWKRMYNTSLDFYAFIGISGFYYNPLGSLNPELLKRMDKTKASSNWG